MSIKETKLSCEQVRWNCDPDVLSFKDTSEVEPTKSIIGQEIALDALRFAIETKAYGQNVYVRGLSGSGRMGMVSQMLKDIDPQLTSSVEHCYVANFTQPDRPVLITVQAGEGKIFKSQMEKLSSFIAEGLKKILETENIQAKKNDKEESVQKEIMNISEPFEAELKEKGLGLININVGQNQQTIVVPLHEGKPVEPEQWSALVSNGEIDEKTQKKQLELQKEYAKKLDEVSRKISVLRTSAMESIQALFESQATQALATEIKKTSQIFNNPEIDKYLEAVQENVIDQFFNTGRKDYDPYARYSVNVLMQGQLGKSCPVWVERNPTLLNLLGTIEAKWNDSGAAMADHMSVKAGSLLRAHGGYLILDARDLLTEPGAWKILIRTLKNRTLEIVPQEYSGPFSKPSLKPQPIPVDIRVILIGDGQIYHILDNQDQDFPELFKVLSDFDSVIDRNQEGFESYAGVISQIAKEENLLPFSAGAVARLIEHGARICSSADKLTAKFSRVADLAREGHYLAAREKVNVIDELHVKEAIARTKRRAGLPSRKFQEMLGKGTINVDTEGMVVGQINGLAVIHSGPVVYGFPSRITTTIAPGGEGVIDIESQSSMSGSIHTKGFHILGGLLRHLLPLDHPLAFSASIAFEQSYGGIDGDSASGAEFCCLISALTGIPINQSFSMTGAIDQHGKVQAIGGVNEKIEGFFDVCAYRKLNGQQGVLIPEANAGELMLRDDVQEACKRGDFSVYAINHITQALEILMGQPAGLLIDGHYPENTILHTAVERAETYWKQSRGKK